MQCKFFVCCFLYGPAKKWSALYKQNRKFPCVIEKISNVRQVSIKVFRIFFHSFWERWKTLHASSNNTRDSCSGGFDIGKFVCCVCLKANLKSIKLGWHQPFFTIITNMCLFCTFFKKHSINRLSSTLTWVNQILTTFYH